MSELNILITTLCWSVLVSISAMLIGWPLGIRLTQLDKRLHRMFTTILVMTLMIPAYVVFYAWWQLWPAGTPVHAWVVEHGYQQFLTSGCLFFALVGWSWPIPALISMMLNRSANVSIVSELDGLSLLRRISNRVQLEWKGLLATFLIVGVVTSSNTTCFDLAQVNTIGNETRAILSMGGSIADFPLLLCTGLLLALLTSCCFLNTRFYQKEHSIKLPKSPMCIMIVWGLCSALPMLLCAVLSIQSVGIEFIDYYSSDLLTSFTIAMFLAVVMAVLFALSIFLNASRNKVASISVSVFIVLFVMLAFLPSSIVVEWVRSVFIPYDWIYQSQGIVVIGQFLKIGFLSVLAGRWVMQSERLQTLIKLDSVDSIHQLFSIIKLRCIAAFVVVCSLSVAYSISELSVTSQLAPPSSSQPIAVALLNAMHYQRPEVITSIVSLFIILAAALGVLVYINQKKVFTLLFLALLVVGCETEQQNPIEDALVIGSIGKSAGQFVTPRAIDANELNIVIIDKTGRLQLLDAEGNFLLSWQLPLSGKGFPTGVTLDKDNMIWIANTHEQNILVYNCSGELLHSFGSYGTGDGQFLYPTDIAFQDDKVYVSEYGGNDRVSIFTKKGEYLRSFGTFGEGEPEFKRPQSLAIHAETGHVYIADAGNHRIAVYDSNGSYLRSIGSAGRIRGSLLYPYGLTFIDANHFVVCEYGNNRLQLFDISGRSLGVVSGAGSQRGLLKTPWAVVKTKKGLLVADTGNNRLQSLPDIMDN